MARDKTELTDLTPDWKTDDWGIPNWQDPSAYGDVSQWEHMRWRWEFRRRRDDIRQFFDQNADESYQYYLALHAGAEWAGEGRTLRPDEPGFTVRTTVDESERYGYSGVPNPRIGAQPSRAIFALDYPGSTTSFYKGSGDLWGRSDDAPTEINVYEGEYAVKFDLSKPLAPQLKGAREHLQWAQKELHGGKTQKRASPDKYLGYLRALDARAAGATWDETSEIYTLGARPAANPLETARNAYSAGVDLSFNFRFSSTID